MNAPEQNRIDMLREAMALLGQGTSKLLAEYDGPASESQAEQEMSHTSQPQLIVTAFSIAQLLIEYGGEHLSALVKTLNEPVEPLASCTCVRSMLESCALATWMLDPAIDHIERVARQFCHRYHGLDQQLKLARAAGADPVTIDSLVSRIDAVEATALSLGYPKLNNSKGERVGIGCKSPKATEIIGQVLDEEPMYRLLSAVAHGHVWSHIRLGFREVTLPESQSQIGGVNVQPMEKTVLVSGMAYLGLGATKAIARPTWYYWRYMGWSVAPLLELFEEVFDLLQVKESSRFWRP